MRYTTIALAITLALFADAVAQAASNEAIKRNNFGSELVKQGRLDEAVSEFRLAVQADPRHAPAQLNLAYTYEKLSRVDEAIAAYKNAVALDPKNAIAFNNLGVLYTKRERYDEAIQTLEQGLTIDPNDATLQKNLTIAKKNREVLGEREARIVEAKNQVEAYPKDPQAAYNLARVYASFDMQDLAFDWLGKALDLGFGDVKLVREDAALAGLRGDPRLARLLDGR